METAADGWLMGRLRALPRRGRLDELLLDRRLRTLDLSQLVAHLGALEDEVAELRAQLAAGAAGPTLASGHVLFLPTSDGYEIVEADEPPPPVGQLLLLDQGCYRVHRTGRSPFPSDRRPCLFLEAEPVDRVVTLP
jgi:hypothetical protein